MTATQAAVAEPVVASTRRLGPLDGLRGVAALVVVLHHVLLVQPALALAYLHPVPNGRAHDLAWWLTYTPLHLFWDGPQAVWVFFVLSGYVLVLPFMRPRGSRPSWLAYYPQRLLRLYLPVWAAIALSVLWIGLVARDPAAGASWWLVRFHPPTVSWSDVVHDGSLVVVGQGSVNTVLWTLKWEVVFSLALPAFVLLGAVARRWWPVKAVLLLAAVGVGAARGIPALEYLPMFGLGTLLAYEGSRLRPGPALRERLRPWHGWALLAVALLLLNASWTLLAVARHVPGGWLNALGGTARAAEVVGAVLVVALVARWDGLAGLGRGPGRWLGQRSYSLYLVHEPLIVSTAFLLGAATPNPVLMLLIAVPGSLALAAVFHRYVEGPSHQLSRAVGRRLGRR
jgi:peptidoglycan/LPS O-acetylase OafA/YrhL